MKQLLKIVLLILETNVAWSFFSTTTRPNIVFMMADDVGYNDFSYHGQTQILTPNIDALAYNGVVMNRFYTQQACTPSRAALLTGNYAMRTGQQSIPMDAGEDRALPLNMPTLPEHLKQLGYTSHLVGKWHLGGSKKSSTPTEKGFDTFFGYWSGWVGYFNYVIQSPLLACNITQGLPPSVGIPTTTPCEKGFDLHDGYRPAWEYQGQYATTVFTEKAVDIIKKSNKDEPFFLFVSHLAGHTGKDGVELEVPNNEENDKDFPYIIDEKRRRFAGIVKEFDKSVGKVVKALEEKNILHNSIIVVLSDNGAQTQGVYENRGSGYPLKGLKFTLLEGGIKGSLVIYSPMLKRKGYINNELMHMSDFMPTFYSAAGGKVSQLGKIDGVDQWRVIKEGIPTTRKELLLNIDQLHGTSAILSEGGRYKLLNHTFLDGIYDAYYGESGRGSTNPPYDIMKVILSDANRAINKVDIFKSVLTIEKSVLMRNELDLARFCNEDDMASANSHVCRGFCLYDLFKDPCETKDIANEHTTLVDAMKERLETFWNEALPYSPRGVDPAADPKYCNGTWFLWKEDPPFCPTALA